MNKNIRKEFSDTIYPTMVIRSQAETIDLQDKEIERLNNIINELEEWLRKNIPIEEKQDLQLVLNKLQELKGSGKSEK